MIAFVVSVNGQQVYKIGVGDSGVFHADVGWIGRSGEPGELTLGVSGLDTQTDEHLRWPEPPEIKVGDTVTIQVIETDTVDTPIARKTPAQLREEEREFLTKMEADHLASIFKKIDEELPRLAPPEKWTQGPSGPPDDSPGF